ncbi:MAG TPA: hypothetical protein VIR57_16215 [Chloroflexota bacterium]|jgi:hypothetical protein
MANIEIAVVNATSDDFVLTDAQAQAAVSPLQKQVHNDFAPAWGIDADLTFVPRGQSPPPGSWWLSLLDTSDQANALGYHDLTSEGLPMGKVFVQTDKLDNLQWTVTASHELLEMLGDPDINLWAFPHPDAKADRLYAYEVCDACEADQLGYDIDGTLVSDFLYPAWFESFYLSGPQAGKATSAQFDKQGSIQQPFAILQGGYSLVYDIQTGTGYHQIFGAVAPANLAPAKQHGPWQLTFSPRQRPRVGSRRERRMTHREQWMRSAVHTACGTERWSIKTLGDLDVGKVAFNSPVTTTVLDLRNQDPQKQAPPATSATLPANNRLDPVELTVYTVTAMLVGAKVEADNDVHLVIADPSSPSETMIAEFPKRECAQTHDTVLLDRMDAARSAVLAAVPPLVQRMAMGGAVPAEAIDPQTGRARLNPMTGKAQITGVGFFDRLHGQDGVAPNGIELHPVLDFNILPTP